MRLWLLAVVAAAACGQLQPHASDKELTGFYRANQETMKQFAKLSLAHPEIAHGERNSDTGCAGTFEAPISNKSLAGGRRP